LLTALQYSHRPKAQIIFWEDTWLASGMSCTATTSHNFAVKPLDAAEGAFLCIKVLKRALQKGHLESIFDHFQIQSKQKLHNGRGKQSLHRLQHLTWQS
jgi:hypothetical protein